MGQASENEKMVNDVFGEAREDSDVDMIEGCMSDSSDDKPPVVGKVQQPPSKAISVVAKNPPEEKKKSCVQYESDSSNDQIWPDSEQESSSELDDEEVQFNGKKFTVTKINRSGTYDFTFLRDKEFLMKSEQQKREFLERQFKLRDDYEKMKIRHENQLEIGDFLKPLLTGEILRMFQNISKSDFQDKHLPVNFNGGHTEYYEKWKYLFMYETYNTLCNSKRSNAKEEDHAKEQNKKYGRDTTAGSQKNRRLNWPCYIVNGLKEEFQSVRMYHEPPHCNGDASVMKSTVGRVDLRSVRDEDVVLLTRRKVKTRGQYDIKKCGGVGFLVELLEDPGNMIAFVKQRKHIGESFVHLLVDNQYSDILEGMCQKDSFCQMHCYHLESLATTVREYKTLKMAEFCKMAPIIMQPTLSLENKKELVDEHQKTILAALNDGKYLFPGGSAEKKKSIWAPKEEFVVDKQANMKAFLNEFKDFYNPSQASVLQKVVEMPEHDILLVQGPPGTGKTHTITGIISMLLTSGVSKILVCGPSNAAVDEIITRLSTKELIKPKVLPKGVELPDKMSKMIVRLGAMEYEPSPIVKKHTLDERMITDLYEQRMYELNEMIGYAQKLLPYMRDKNYEFLDENNNFKEETVTLLQKLVMERYKDLKKWLKKTERKEQLKKIEFTLSNFKRQLKKLEKQGHRGQRQEGDTKFVENNLILKTPIVCCTLSMAGINKMRFVNNVDYLIVDEACQAIEPSTLVPFLREPQRVILVGDQNQLPATTFSENSNRTQFSRSLFERLLQSGYQKTMLTIQYRMHPSIRQWPSNSFYNNLIQDHESIMTRDLPESLRQDFITSQSKRVLFFDITDSIEEDDEKSKCNYFEADLTQVLIHHLLAPQGQLKKIKGQIGVISPYKSQVRKVKNNLGPLCRDQGVNPFEAIEVNTVDAFQGREKDVIIFNCVRANKEGQLGFLTDERRLNVAITRPKHLLYIIGNSRTLKNSEVWASMIASVNTIQIDKATIANCLKDPNLIKSIVTTSQQNGSKEKEEGREESPGYKRQKI